MSHGAGIFYYSDGARYEGSFHKDQKHGQGTMYLNNGEVYSETWQHGKRLSSVRKTKEAQAVAAAAAGAKSSRRPANSNPISSLPLAQQTRVSRLLASARAHTHNTID